MAFELKDLSKYDIFTNTEKLASSIETMEIALENLEHYYKHPFKLYTGQRFADMVESIKENGLLSPLIVRPTLQDTSRYEILSGHNRFEASKLVGLHTLPCIVKRHISEDEAYLIVTESNLIQRSFADLSHSERALILATHYETIKRQGKRSDFIKEIENEIKNTEINGDKPDEYNENSTCATMLHKPKSRDKLAEDYGLNRGTIAHYIRINKLIELLKNKIDNNELSIRAGVSLSYLTENEQQLVVDYMDENNLKLDIKKAEQLRELSEIKMLNEKTVEEIFLGKKMKSTTKPSTTIKIKRKKYERFFTGKESQTEIEETFEKALEFYFKFKDSVIEEETENKDNSSDGDYAVDTYVDEKISATKYENPEDFDLDEATSE